MKKIILMSLLLMISTNCKGQSNNQNKENNANDTIMETFNMKKYENLKSNPKYSGKGFYINDNGDEIRIMGGEKDIIEETKKNGSPFSIIKTFYKNALLKKIDYKFYNFSINITREYNENGKLIEETDWNNNYPFKVEDLCKLIKEEYGIDLMIKSDPNKNELQYKVIRNYNQHLYLVVFSYGYSDEGEAGFPTKTIYVDGKSGKILYEDAQFLDRPNGDKIPKSKTSFPQKNKVIKERKTSFIALPEEKGTYEKPQLGTAYTSQSELSGDKNIYQVYEGRYYTKAEWEEFQKSLPWWKKIF